ncbi:MAG: alpha/beta hydrolase [Clostridia bacterium]|nr:alpha/beta hydrolase [Clostridia bacterium]MBQ4603172.1 alpha/beta hydrolase [Clostridia bacterium]
MKKIISILCVFAVVLASLSVLGFAVDTSYKPYEDSQYFRYGDYDIHYRVIPAKGQQKGRIMMLHGFLCSTYAWRNMADILSEEGYECVLADLPNFGFSTRENEDMEIVDRETLITELMKSIAPMNEWILAGHSMGGGVAVNIAINNPVKSLLLYCPAPQSEFPEAMEGFITSAPMKFVMDTFFNHGTRIDFLVKLVIFFATMDWDFAMNYDVSGVTDAVQYDRFGSGMCEMMYNVKPTDLENASKIACPVLLCQASDDIILNTSMKEQMNSAFPDATTYTVEGGGHQCIENRAEELCEVTTEFLNK